MPVNWKKVNKKRFWSKVKKTKDAGYGLPAFFLFTGTGNSM